MGEAVEHFDILIIGGGAAGMAAAVAVSKKGYQKILLVDRNERSGGVLLQCAHKGFGLGYFKEELTGPEYADRFAAIFETAHVTERYSTSVIQITPDRTAFLAGKGGMSEVSFDVCIFATGCRERTIYSLNVAGTRPAGIMTCGMAQKLIHIDHLYPGDDIVILGTGDVGQVVARDLIRAGKRVLAMIEKESRPGGLKRNQKQCIEAYSIPLVLNSTIAKIHGEKRISGVTVRDHLTGNETFLKCSTLLTAIGMIPEMDLARDILQDGNLPPWALKVGNCDFVHDIVDSVTADGLALAI